jgi:hypothetical protein
MKKVFFVSLCLFFASSAHAYNVINAEPAEAYDIIPIEGDPYVQREYLGDLMDYPDMYEFTTDVSMTLSLRLRQRDSDKAVPFGLIIVRQNDDDGGVTEVQRVNQPVAEWHKTTDSMLGVHFLEGEFIQREVSPGTYRIEVSTPDNKGAYMLVVGDESVRSGFFSSLAQAYKTQRHFGYWPFRIFLSSLVYYPLGILIIGYGIFITAKHRDKLRVRTILKK